MEDNKYNVSEACEGDLKAIQEFFERNDFVLKDKALLHWKYLSNPGGRARTFLIRDEGLNIQGTLSYLPRICVKRNSERFLVVQAVDAFIAPEARGRGLYQELIQYSTKKIGVPIYGFPNNISEKILVKSGWRILGPMASWYLPINAGGLLSAAGIAFLAPLVNFICKIYAFLWLGSKKSDLELRPITEFKNDFIASHSYCWIERSAEFLNWRFVHNPGRKFVCYEFVSQGEAVGYCSLAIEHSSARVYDFVSYTDMRGCLRKIVQVLRAKGITHLSYSNLGMSLWKLGFVKKRTNNNMISCDLTKECWLFTLGDSDWD